MLGRLREGAEAVSQILALATVALAPVPFGSADERWVALWCAILGISLALADTRALAPLHRRFAALTLALLLGWVAIAVLQQTAPPPLPLADPIWSETDALLPGLAIAPRIAATASSPWPHVAMPLLMALCFLRFLLIARAPSGAARVSWVLLVSIPAIGLLALLAHRADPRSLLGAEKVFYLDAFTGTFVNGNTAASWFGLGLILWSCHAASSVSERRRRRSRSWTQQFLQITDRITPQRIGLLLAWLVCLGLLVATASRAGTILSLVSAAAAAALVLRPHLSRPALSMRGLLLGTAALLAVAMLLTGGSVGERLGRDGLVDVARLETYRVSWSLVEVHPWFGIGAGAFPAVFPSVRSDALGMFGIWDRAHSTPLELAVEMGLPFAAATVAAWVATAAVLLRQVWSRPSPVIAAALGAALLAGLHSLIDFPMQTAGFLVPATALIAAGIGDCGAFRATVENRVAGSKGTRPKFV